MKKLLTLLLLLPFGAVESHECELHGLYPATLSTVSGLAVTNFSWVSPQPLPFPAPDPYGSENCTTGVRGIETRPDHPVALVHNALSTDQVWNFAVQTVQTEYLDDNGFPFWSLQLADASQQNLGVLTATLFPGRSEIGVSYSEHLVTGDPRTRWTYVSYASAPYCAAVSVRLERPTSGPRQLAIYSNCGNMPAKRYAGFGIGSTLQPANVRYGKLSADLGPDGEFYFSFDPFSNATPTATQRPR